MSKPVIQLHTIDQWMKLDKGMQSIILQNIKLKDRLYKFLKNEWSKKQAPASELVNGWRPCPKCEKKGWVIDEPRLPGIHPSQLPHPCMLKIYNEMIGMEAKEKIEARTRLIFDLGHAAHDMFQRYGMKGAWGPIYEPEVRLSKDFQELSEELLLEGHADAENVLTVDDIPDSPYSYEVGIVHEYKTINSSGFDKLTRPKPQHKTQALIYSAALNRPIVVYMYLNKNDQNMVDYPVPFDPEAWALIEGKARILKKHFEALTPPPATTGYHCQQCPYVFNCPDYAAVMKK